MKIIQLPVNADLTETTLLEGAEVYYNAFHEFPDVLECSMEDSLRLRLMKNVKGISIIGRPYMVGEWTLYRLKPVATELNILVSWGA